MKPLAEHKTRLIFEEGCLDKKGELLLSLGERALILTGKNGAVRSGALADAIVALSANDQTFRIFDKIGENPTTEICREAAKEALNARADFVLAIGGGSVMDAGKLVALLAATGEESEIDGFTDDLLYSADLSKAACLPIAVVGTTAGTGSEVTNIAVLTRKDGTKKGISAPCLYPAIAFADTRYTESMSPLTTCSTGLDALCHLLESYFSEEFDPRAEAVCLEGISLAVGNLLHLQESEAYAKRSEFRKKMHKASLLGGYAIDLCRTAFPHMAGYALTEKTGLPHGLATALFLPVHLALVEEFMPERAQKMEKECGFSCQDISKLADSLVLSWLFAGDWHLSEDLLHGEEARYETAANRKRTPSVPDAEELLDLAKERLSLVLSS